MGISNMLAYKPCSSRTLSLGSVRKCFISEAAVVVLKFLRSLKSFQAHDSYLLHPLISKIENSLKYKCLKAGSCICILSTAKSSH